MRDVFEEYTSFDMIGYIMRCAVDDDGVEWLCQLLLAEYCGL